MCFSRSTIELINKFDEYRCQEGELSSDKIRRWSGEFMVDTGAIRVAINEEIKEKLGLKRGQVMNIAMADGSTRTVEMVGGIKVRFGNRNCYTDAFVLPGNT